MTTKERTLADGWCRGGGSGTLRFDGELPPTSAQNLLAHPPGHGAQTQDLRQGIQLLIKVQPTGISCLVLSPLS